MFGTNMRQIILPNVNLMLRNCYQIVKRYFPHVLKERTRKYYILHKYPNIYSNLYLV